MDSYSRTNLYEPAFSFSIACIVTHMTHRVANTCSSKQLSDSFHLIHPSQSFKSKFPLLYRISRPNMKNMNKNKQTHTNQRNNNDVHIILAELLIKLCLFINVLQCRSDLGQNWVKQGKRTSSKASNGIAETPEETLNDSTVRTVVIKCSKQHRPRLHPRTTTHDNCQHQNISCTVTSEHTKITVSHITASAI